MKNNKIKICTFSMGQKCSGRVDEMSATLGLNKSDVVRRAVDEYYEKRCIALESGEASDEVVRIYDGVLSFGKGKKTVRYRGLEMGFRAFVDFDKVYSIESVFFDEQPLLEIEYRVVENRFIWMSTSFGVKMDSILEFRRK